MRDWDQVVAFALTLPGTERALYYGQLSVKVAANGRPFLNVGHEPDSSFVLHLDLDTIEVLKETAPGTFWQTPHYEGHGAVLVRFAGDDPERVRATIGLARDQAAARKPAKPRKR